MPSLATLAAFALASLVFVAIPGPNMLYIVGHGITRGRRHALAAAVGVELGTLVHIAAAAAGLSALVASSATAFTTVKYLGIAYLVHLGVRALRRLPGNAVQVVDTPTDTRPLVHGVVVNVLNPKAALFFMAFLPQFMDQDANAAPQALVLGAVLFVVAMAVDLIFAFGAAAIGRRIGGGGPTRRHRHLLAAVYLTLAGLAVITGQRPATT